MCSGPRKPSPPPSPPTGPAAMDGSLKKPASASLLLELSASDDLLAFKCAVEEDGLPVDSPAPWYGRSVGSRRMVFDQRTPLQIAALYGSTAVLGYILSSPCSDVNRPCGSDGATALHCAASGGSSSSFHAIKMLIDASADVDALDVAGNRPGDVIPRQASGSATRSLEVVLQAPFPPRVSSPSKEDDPKKGEIKKEYPLDLTLPDIKNGIYGTDDFRMYTFKVKPCSRAYSHDWTECPFVHPGENARRRDPRKYLYTCVPCPEFRKGSCRNGDSCEYAHGVFESWLHPAQYRTRLCKDETGCNRRVCFFAHKPNELRSVNPSAASVSGLLPPSPRSPSLGLSSTDLAAAFMMMQQGPGSPISPATSSGMGSSAMWMNQQSGAGTPTLQLPSSRLKASLSARDLEFDLDMMALDGYQQKLINEISGTASPRSSLRMSAIAAASRASDYSDLLGSLDPSMLSQLQGLSLKQSAATASSQFQSSAGSQRHQTMNQQLLSGYGGNHPSSPTMSSSSFPTMSPSSSFGLDLSTAKAMMNSRSSALAKRSMSFCDRGAAPAGRHPGLSNGATSGLSDWGSPDGRLDWGIQGEELNKLRKSASFGIRSSSGGGPGSPIPNQSSGEPDLSWVHSLVRDGPAVPVGQPKKQQQYQLNGGLPTWAEQMIAEQEQQMVA